MKIELSEKEIGVILSALERKKEFYKHVCESPNRQIGRAAEESLEALISVEEKLESGISSSTGSQDTPELESNESSGGNPSKPTESGKFLYLYLPDGIRDKGLEEELSSRIPETDDPEPDNFFWSSKFNNFVVKANFEAEVREAIRARFNGDAILKENPGWAKKPNTWQVIRKDDINGSEGAQKEGQEVVPRVS